MSLSTVGTRRFTPDEYYRMAEAGIFQPGERVELIEGEIVPLSPQNPPHARRTSKITMLFVRAYGDTHAVRVGLPLSLPPASEPEPDFALVSFAAEEQARRHPESADLVLELSDSSLRYDRTEKASVYAKAGLPEYWVLNLVQGNLEVNLDPGPDPEAPFGFAYRSRRIYQPDERVTPSRLPGTSFLVGDLLG